MQPELNAVILAAGFGKRMKSALPKPLHPILGLPMLEYSLRAVAAVTPRSPVVVIGHGADQIRRAFESRARFALQSEQLGTAHALRMAGPLLAGEGGMVLLITGDMPLLTAGTLQALVQAQAGNPGPLSLLTVILENSHGFGRVIRAADGSVLEIVEEAQATPEILQIQELNASVYCFEAGWLWSALERVPLSPKGEYYLTDLVGIAVREGRKVQALVADDPDEALGINTREHLAEAEAVMRRRINTAWMLAGVTLVDPPSVTIEADVRIGADTIIYPGSYLSGPTVIGANCQIGPNATIKNSHLGDGCIVQSAWIEDTKLGTNEQVDAYQHLCQGKAIPVRSGESLKDK